MQQVKYSKQMYNKMITYAKSMRPHTPQSIYHNTMRLQNTGKMNCKTYEGYMACGQMTYCLTPILYEEGHRDLKLLVCRMGGGKHIDDHMYIMVNDHYIVDPTWRQFFGGYLRNNKELENYLYEYNNPIFVGSFAELHLTITYAIALAGIKCNTEKQWIYGMWERPRDVSNVK